MAALASLRAEAGSRPDKARLERLWRAEDVALREKALWRLLYETAARANEILALDIADLDLANKRARVRSKGGAVEWVFWQTGAPSSCLVFSPSAGPAQCSWPTRCLPGP